MRAATPAAEAAKPSPALVGAVKTTRILAQSDGFDREKIALVIRKVRFVDCRYSLESRHGSYYSHCIVIVLRKVLREPVAQAVIARVFTELSERTAARLVRR